MAEITPGKPDDWEDTSEGYVHSEFDRHTGTIGIYQGNDDQWYWRLTALNGEVVAQGEGYTRKGDAVRGWSAVRRAAQAPKLDTHAGGDDR